MIILCNKKQFELLFKEYKSSVKRNLDFFFNDFLLFL